MGETRLTCMRCGDDLIPLIGTEAWRCVNCNELYRFPELLPEPDDYDGQRFFEGLMWALGFTALFFGAAWLILHLLRR